MAPKRGRAAPLVPEERRQAIVDAVVPLLIQHGHTVTTRQIAEAAGIAEGTIFRVFPDKRALLLAAAQETANPATGRQEMAETLAVIPALRDKVTATVEFLVARMERVMVVMMALRGLCMTEGPGTKTGDEPPGPPPFIVESNRALLEMLTELLFLPHRDELRMAPGEAAVVLRSLVFGAWHPGMDPDHRVTPDEIADALLHGVGLNGVGKDAR